MKIEEIRELSYYIITEYYKNNLNPFWEYLDENIIWYGPAKGQIIVGKNHMREAWENEKHQLKFSMRDITNRVIAINRSIYSTILSFYVYTHYPNGTTHVHNQNIDITWIERKSKSEDGKIIKKPYIIKIFIANLHTKNEKDNIYAIHGESENIQQIQTNHFKRIILKDKSKDTLHYIIVNNIVWVEKTNGGANSIIHTINEDINCIENTSYIQKQSDNFFLSPHISYLVNPLYINKIERFKVTLDNNKKLPIVEKKYTKFKNDLKKWNPS